MSQLPSLLFNPEFYYLHVLHVQAGFLKVLQIPPPIQNHDSRWEPEMD